MQAYNTTKNLLDPDTKSLSSVWIEPRTQQTENEDTHAAFSCSLLPTIVGKSEHEKSPQNSNDSITLQDISDAM